MAFGSAVSFPSSCRVPTKAATQTQRRHLIFSCSGGLLPCPVGAPGPPRHRKPRLLALVFFSCDLVVLRWSVLGACPREGVWRGGGSACPQGTGLGGGETGVGLDLDERFQRNFKSLEEILVFFQKKREEILVDLFTGATTCAGCTEDDTSKCSVKKLYSVRRTLNMVS
jgi:hypothetical protein